MNAAVESIRREQMNQEDERNRLSKWLEWLDAESRALAAKELAQAAGRAESFMFSDGWVEGDEIGRARAKALTEALTAKVEAADEVAQMAFIRWEHPERISDEPCNNS